MKFFRKNLFSISAFVFMAFFSILAIEGAHHHDNTLESHDDCSICSWQATGSQAPSTPVPPVIPQPLLFVFFLFFTPSFVSSFNSFPSPGRSPPKNLL
jgi:hypothetical protein